MDETPEVNSNVQATPEAPSQTSTGPNLEEQYKARVAELERQSEGRLRDLQNEREKRQELEARLSSVQTPVSSPVTQDVGQQDELGKVLNPYISPAIAQAQQAAKEARMVMEQYQRDQALRYLSEQTGKHPKDILADTAFQQKLQATASKWGVSGSIVEQTQRAYELMQLEDLKAKEADRARAAAVASQQTMSGGVVPQSSGASAKKLSLAEFNAMPASQYDEMERGGRFHKDGDSIIYTPHSK